MTHIFRFSLADSITFCKTKEANGCLSNMAAYPIYMGDIAVRTSEHLYQAMRFTDPDLQQKIIDVPSPIGAKMTAKKHIDQTRENWDSYRVSIMRWCLGLKLLNNPNTFGKFLVECVSNPATNIVEISTKDNFWGAIPDGTGYAYGNNVLGSELWALGRKHEIKLPISTSPDCSIPDFLFLGKDAVQLALDGLQHVSA